MWVAASLLGRIKGLLGPLTALILLVPASAFAADYDNISSLGTVVDAPPAEAAAIDIPEAIDIAAAELPRSVSISMPGLPRRAVSPPASREHRSNPHFDLIVAVAQRYGIDPHLLAAVVKTESAGNGRAVSRKGALGLMQVMPATARSLGVGDPQRLLTDPGLALEVGASYLKVLQARLGNNVPLVLAAYNAGPGAVVRAGMRIPAYRETQAYVGRVMAGYAASRAAALR